MKIFRIILVLLVGFCLTPFNYGTLAEASGKKRLLVVDSYHREYLWSQDTNGGVVAAFLDFKYLDNEKQGEEYTKKDYVESSKAVIKKLWMDTKRKTYYI